MFAWIKCISKSTFYLHIVITLYLTSGFTFGQKRKDEKHYPLAIQENLLFVSTLDGSLHGINSLNGIKRWSVTPKDDPVLKVPTDIKTRTFLPDPMDGSLYVYSKIHNGLKKMPFTIPELVSASPCRSSDGILYTGRKKDTWFSLDTQTGYRVNLNILEGHEPSCPQSTSSTVFIGKTEYTIAMVSSEDKVKRWNATFSEYASERTRTYDDYDLRHFSSASTGSLLTYEGANGLNGLFGSMKWQFDFASPVVAMYALEQDGLHKIPFRILSSEALEYIRKELPNLPDDAKSNYLSRLYPTLHVGQFDHGLYALPSMADTDRAVIAPRFLPEITFEPDPPEDPEKIIKPGQEERETTTAKPRPSRDVSMRIDPKQILLFGNHPRPDDLSVPIIPIRQPAAGPIIVEDKSYTETHVEVVSPLIEYSLQIVCAITVLVIVLAGSLYYLRSVQQITENSLKRIQEFEKKQGSYGTSMTGFPSNNSMSEDNMEVPEGYFKVGKMLYNPKDILGRGCEGTIVYRGRFDDRDVAVKRILPECFSLADKEVQSLREADQHPCVIRYHCTERDSQFRYIALELAQGTLDDYIDKRITVPNLSKKTILEQACSGIEHLHKLNIVHRDIKPHNVLLSMPAQDGTVRAMISDFGLCKKLAAGRHSFSKRSGIAGTEGWIAPEMLDSEQRVTAAVDTFSSGCLIYYVISGGKHPFGDKLRRQANILSKEYTLEALLNPDGSEHICTLHLVCMMIDSDPNSRPNITQVLCHPFFWSDEKQLQFFSDVSDRVEKESEGSFVVRALEDRCSSILGGDWKDRICQHLFDDLRKFRTYRGTSLRDLLRAMRNKKHHYRELPKELAESLGSIPDEFVRYFTSRFPKLLLHAYLNMKCVDDETIFEKYYNRN